MAIYLNFLEASCLVSLKQIIFCHVLPENVHTPHTRDKKFQGEGVSASAGVGQGGVKVWERVLESLSFKRAFVLIMVTLISSILFWQLAVLPGNKFNPQF